MTSYNESTLDGCPICMDDSTIGVCISQKGLLLLNGKNTDCSHYACRDCWNKMKALNNKCPICRIEIHKDFPKKNINEFLISIGMGKFTNMLLDIMEIDMIGKQISDISSISALKNLKIVRFDNNDIVDISTLASLTNLTELYLSNNRIEDISPLANLFNLKKLYLCGNSIKDISSLASLVNLTYLDLNNNDITDISVISNRTALRNLKELYLKENPITDYNQLDSRIDILTYY
jgi:Leucine-rich repeat (LRR) protein